MVINLEDSIAITQNFVGKTELKNVLKFLKSKSEQISGFKDLEGKEDQIYDTFVTGLKAKGYGDLLKEIALQIETEENKNGKRRTELFHTSGVGETFTFGFDDILEGEGEESD